MYQSSGANFIRIYSYQPRKLELFFWFESLSALDRGTEALAAVVKTVDPLSNRKLVTAFMTAIKILVVFLGEIN